MKTGFVSDPLTNKLILLFVLDKMEIPLTETSLLDICSNRNDWLNYMDCKDIMWQLQNVDFIIKCVDAENECRYKISAKGRECLACFDKDIPLSLRNEITDFAKDNILDFKKNQEYVGKYAKNLDNTYTATLKIKDPLEGKNMLEIKMTLPSIKQAITICKNWRDKAPEIYEKLFDMSDLIEPPKDPNQNPNNN